MRFASWSVQAYVRLHFGILLRGTYCDARTRPSTNAWCSVGRDQSPKFQSRCAHNCAVFWVNNSLTQHSSDAYRGWRPSVDWYIGDTINLVRSGRRPELHAQLLSGLGPDYLGAACRHMAEWHRSREEHAEAGLISAAARDLASNGDSALLLHALTDHWIETDHPS